MKKIFISMPMNGKESSEILSEQEKLLNLTGAYLHEDVSQVESYLSDSYKHTPIECLGESLKRMSTADYVVFADGYENARGCRIEYAVAKEYGKEILIEHAGKIQEVS